MLESHAVPEAFGHFCESLAAEASGGSDEEVLGLDEVEGQMGAVAKSHLFFEGFDSFFVKPDVFLGNTEFYVGEDFFIGFGEVDEVGTIREGEARYFDFDDLIFRGDQMDFAFIQFLEFGFDGAAGSRGPDTDLGGLQWAKAGDREERGESSQSME